VASAGAVRDGQAVGRGDPHGVSRSGWTALAIGVVFMASAAVTFLLVPAPIIRFFTTDPTVVATGIWLLFVAALFQLFDGLQGVATGVLRGLGDTRTAMVSNVAGHWVFGLPVGYLLCFAGGWGVVGLWVGLCIGLVLVAITLVWTWTQRSRAFRLAELVPLQS
jgi:MATE family multidrug resistance protein